MKKQQVVYNTVRCQSICECKMYFFSPKKKLNGERKKKKEGQSNQSCCQESIKYQRAFKKGEGFVEESRPQGMGKLGMGIYRPHQTLFPIDFLHCLSLTHLYH